MQSGKLNGKNMKDLECVFAYANNDKSSMNPSSCASYASVLSNKSNFCHASLSSNSYQCHPKNLSKPEVALEKWFVQPIPGSRDIVVCGINANRENRTSGAIEILIKPRCVVTRSGAKYKLVGPIKQVGNMPVWFEKKFKNGFPKTWKHHVAEYFDWLGHRDDESVLGTSTNVMPDGDTHSFSEVPVKLELHNWALNISGNQIFIEGFALGSDGIPQLYRTSAITNAVDGTILYTSSGSVYRIKGPMSMQATARGGISQWFARNFDTGFPSNWKVLVENYVQHVQYQNGSFQSNGIPDKGDMISLSSSDGSKLKHEEKIPIMEWSSFCSESETGVDLNISSLSTKVHVPDTVMWHKQEDAGKKRQTSTSFKKSFWNKITPTPDILESKTPVSSGRLQCLTTLCCTDNKENILNHSGNKTVSSAAGIQRTTKWIHGQHEEDQITEIPSPSVSFSVDRRKSKHNKGSSKKNCVKNIMSDKTETDEQEMLKSSEKIKVDNDRTPTNRYEHNNTSSSSATLDGNDTITDDSEAKISNHYFLRNSHNENLAHRPNSSTNKKSENARYSLRKTVTKKVSDHSNESVIGTPGAINLFSHKKVKNTIAPEELTNRTTSVITVCNNHTTDCNEGRKSDRPSRYSLRHSHDGNKVNQKVNAKQEGTCDSNMEPSIRGNGYYLRQPKAATGHAELVCTNTAKKDNEKKNASSSHTSERTSITSKVEDELAKQRGKRKSTNSGKKRGKRKMAEPSQHSKKKRKTVNVHKENLNGSDSLIITTEKGIVLKSGKSVMFNQEKFVEPFVLLKRLPLNTLTKYMCKSIAQNTDNIALKKMQFSNNNNVNDVSVSKKKECQAQRRKGVDKLKESNVKQNSKIKSKVCDGQTVNEGCVINAKRGSMKRRQQVRNVIEIINKPKNEQDLFSSTDATNNMFSIFDNCFSHKNFLNTNIEEPVTPSAKFSSAFYEHIATPAWLKTPKSLWSVNNVDAVTPAHLKHFFSDQIVSKEAIDAADRAALEFQKGRKGKPKAIKKDKKQKCKKSAVLPADLFHVEVDDDIQSNDNDEYFSE